MLLRSGPVWATERFAEGELMGGLQGPTSRPHDFSWLCRDAINDHRQPSSKTVERDIDRKGKEWHSAY